MSKFNERLNELMFDRKISVEELAKKLQVSLATVYFWKKDEMQISYSKLIPLCEILHCSIDFLIGRSELELPFIPKAHPPFSQAIRKVMREKNISTYQLRRETRFDGSYFVRWDKGADCYLSTLMELADYFNCTVDYLVGREK